MLRFGVVALGVSDARRAADFWSAALGYELREDGFGGWAKVLVPPDGAGTAIALQLSRTPPQEHPRLHVDLHAADAGEQEAEAARLVSLGARRVDWDSYPEDPDFIVLEDPEGNRFCIVDLSHEPASLGFAVPRSFAAVLPGPARPAALTFLAIAFEANHSEPGHFMNAAAAALEKQAVACA